MDFLKAKCKSKTAAGLILVVTGLALGCTKRGTVSGGGTSNVSGVISITKVYPSSAGASWNPIVASNRYYIKGLSLTIEGSCSRGIATITANEGAGNYPETATCLGTGTFTWTRTYTSLQEGDKTLTLQALDLSGAIVSGATVSVDVRIDNTAPPAPVITDPAASPYTFSGAQSPYTIVGTVSADTARLTGPAGVTITPAGTAWTYDATIIPNSSIDFTFYAFDLAGNQSAGTTQTIQWTPSISLLVSGPFSGGILTDGVSLFGLEGAGQAESSNSVHAGSDFELLSGFNQIVNKVRTD